MNEYMINDTYYENKIKILAKRFLSNLIRKIKYNKVSTPRSELVSEFMDAVSRIECGKTLNSTPSLNQWEDICIDIIKNIKKYGTDNFLQWPCIQHSMGDENSTFLFDEYRWLKRTEWWKFNNQKIKYPSVGNPRPFLLNFNLTGATVHHSYCLSRLHEKTNINLSTLDYIIEFGGGYGNMCKIIHDIGFKGKYYIFDFEIMNELQNFFLRSQGIENVILVNSDLQWRDLLNSLPNEHKGLFIATWSLSESPMSARETTSQFFKKFSYFLIGYQEIFGEIDNSVYFNELVALSPDKKWHTMDMPKLNKHHLLLGS